MTAQSIFDVELLARIADAATARDRQDADLSAEVSWLHSAGALASALPAALSGQTGWADDPLSVASVMAAVGQASLPLGRLYEGHVNAGQLVALYGSSRLKAQCVARVREGALLGVWGADGSAPVAARRNGEDFVLSGQKCFCSGLGLVQLALISAAHDGGTWLMAVDASDKARADASQWRVSGMRATASGGYDFAGVIVQPESVLGGGDDYYVEPYFLGGMYRMCAVQSGGLDALIAEFIDYAKRRNVANSGLLHYRVGSLLTQSLLAKAATLALARLVSVGDHDEIARHAVLIREGVEHCITVSLSVIERAAGTAVHREDTTLSRIARDLSFYIRQGAIDDRLIDIGANAMSSNS